MLCKSNRIPKSQHDVIIEALVLDSFQSINFYAHQSPQKALMVTSALTVEIFLWPIWNVGTFQPLVPKRTQASHKTSDDSVNLEQPETVQRVKNIKQIRSLLYEPNRVGAETKEISVQTGNTIRLRQYSWTDGEFNNYLSHSGVNNYFQFSVNMHTIQILIIGKTDQTITFLAISRDQMNRLASFPVYLDWIQEFFKISFRNSLKYSLKK